MEDFAAPLEGDPRLFLQVSRRPASVWGQTTSEGATVITCAGVPWENLHKGREIALWIVWDL